MNEKNFNIFCIFNCNKKSVDFADIGFIGILQLF